MFVSSREVKAQSASHTMKIRLRTVHSSLNRFFSRNCLVGPVLFRELSHRTSSFSGTVPYGQFFFGNCPMWTVLFQELFHRAGSFSRSVWNHQLYFSTFMSSQIFPQVNKFLLKFGWSPPEGYAVVGVRYKFLNSIKFLRRSTMSQDYLENGLEPT